MNTTVFIKRKGLSGRWTVQFPNLNATHCAQKAILSIKTLNLNKINITALNRNSQAENTNTEQKKLLETDDTKT